MEKDKKDKKGLKCYTKKAPISGKIYTTCNADAQQEKPKKKKKKLVLKARPKKSVEGQRPPPPPPPTAKPDEKVKKKRLVLKVKPKKSVEKPKEQLKPVIDRDLPDDVLNLIKGYSIPHREMIEVVDFRFVTREVQGERGKRGLVYSDTPEVMERAEMYFKQFINRIKEIGGNPSDYVHTTWASNKYPGIYYRKPTRKIRQIISVSDRKATAAFKKRTGLDRMVATTSVTFTFPTPIGVGGDERGAVIEKKMPVGVGAGNIENYISDEDKKRIIASAKYKKLKKDAESKGWYAGIRAYGRALNQRTLRPLLSFDEWLEELPYLD